MKGVWRKLAALLLSQLLFFALPTAAWALEDSEEAPQTIRVGVCVAPGENLFHDSSMKSGYLADYLKRLSYYAGMKGGRPVVFEFVPAKSEFELQELLAAGAVDLMEIRIHEGSICSVGGPYPADFLDRYRMIDRPVGETLYSLCTLNRDRTVSYEDILGISGASIGILRNDSGLPLLQEYARGRGLRYGLSVYDSRSDLSAALEGGEIQAVVTSLGGPDFCRVVAPLGKMQLYLCASVDRPLAAELVSELQEILYAYEPYYNSHLADLYFSERNDLYDAFSSEELAYVQTAEPVRIAACVDERPNVYFDRKEQAFHGTYVDMLELMAEHSGIQFEYVPAQSWDECLLLVREGKADAVVGVYGLSGIADKWGLVFTDPLVSKYIAVIGETGRLPNEDGTQTVGITSDRSEEWAAYILENFPAWDERFYTSEGKCFEAVSEGVVNFSLIDGNSTETNRLYTKYKGVSTISSLSQKVEIVIGVSNKAPAPLPRIINKAARSLSASDILTCQMENALSYEMDVYGFVREYLPYFILLSVALIIAFLSIWSVAEHRRKYAEQKSAFFSNMSHEIRTPLNGIIGMTEIAKKNLRDADRTHDCLEKIDGASQHLLTIVNDILDLSKLENNKMPIAREPLDLGALLRSLHTLYFEQAREHGLDYDTVIWGMEEEHFIGDATRINQVLMNLLSNAIKFTPAGRKVRLRVERLDKRSQTVWLRFSVTDEGIGIPRENLTRIFNAYEQQGAKTAGKYGGSGLGLPISRQLVDLMGGTLSVRSEPGKGSEFFFSLPLPIDSDAERRPGPERFAGGRALVLSPEKDTRDYLGSLFTSLGIACQSADTGEEAAALAAKGGFGYLLIDWELPAAQREPVLRALPDGGRPLLLASSSRDRSELREELDAAGAAGLAPKPILPSVLTAALEELSGVPKKPRDGENEIPVFLPGARVLIVEDNELNCEILYELLRPTGCTIDTAGTGKEALDRFAASSSGEYGLIFMDIQMPEMNGYEATRAIRALDRPDASAVAIVAMTADAFPADVARAHEAGMDEHLSKPIDIRLLYETMRRFLTKDE